ncbi:MAG: hypothetical protein ACKOD2_15525 [Ilumatobacteraceae bacterium]
MESTPGNAREVTDWLQSAGHETLTCFDAPVGFGCRGVTNHDDCPLDEHTDAALLVRDLDGSGHTLTEMGAMCALRHRVPVVELVEPHNNQLDATMLSVLEDVHLRCENRDYVIAALEALARVPGIDVTNIEIAVTRTSGRVHAMVQAPADMDAQQVPMVVDWVGRALRNHDRYAKVIDVGFHRGAAAPAKP